MMTRFLLAGLLAVLALPGQVTVLTHAMLIDGSGGPPQPDATIVLANGKIRNIGPAPKVKIPALAKVVDLSGKTVIPGIINLHGHVGMARGLTSDVDNYTRENVEAQLRTYARYGVTTTTSLGVDQDLILEIRDEQRRGKISGARVFTALQGFTFLGGYPSHIPGLKGVVLEVASAAQARAWINRLADKGADVVKIWVDDDHDTFRKLPPTIYSAVIKQAHKRGLKVFAHLYELSDAKGLADAGVDVLAHSVRDAAVDEALISAMKRNKVTLVATLTREQSTFAYVDPPAWLDDPFFRLGVDPAVIEGVRTQLRAKQAKDPKLAVNKNGFQVATRNLKALADGGVRIGFGADSGPPGRFQGFFEHWEMELMVKAGLTPMQVIESFSKNAAAALGVSNQLGTLAKGKAGDLIVLDKNPLEDIRNARAIHAVYVGGQRLK